MSDQHTKVPGGAHMRFMLLMILKGHEKALPQATQDADATEAMMKYNEFLRNAGVLLALDGLHPLPSGSRVSFSGGRSMVTDGPFSQSKETVAGYWLIQAKSIEEAIEWARRCPGSDDEVIEIRQVQEYPQSTWRDSGYGASFFWANAKIGAADV